MMSLDISQVITGLAVAVLIYLVLLSNVKKFIEQREYEHEMKGMAPGFVKVSCNKRFKDAVIKNLRTITTTNMDAYSVVYQESYRSLTSSGMANLKALIRGMSGTADKSVYDNLMKILVSGKYEGIELLTLRSFITAHAFVDEVSVPIGLAINLLDTNTEEYKKAVVIATYLSFLQSFYTAPASFIRTGPSSFPVNSDPEKIKEFAKTVVRHYLRIMAAGRFNTFEAFMCEDWFVKKLISINAIDKSCLCAFTGSILTAFSVVTNTPIPTVVPGQSADVDYFILLFKHEAAGKEIQKKENKPSIKLVVHNGHLVADDNHNGEE